MKLPKVYEPSAYEADIYALWEKSGAFEPKNRGGAENYSIVLPPPNANGDLHVGHSLMFALQDAVIRYHRMKGDNTLWLPGADHAGFETQVVYEKQLEKEGKSRFDFTREELYGQIWDFVAANRENYEQQFRRLGASVDWTRYTYTLDDKIIKQAYATFKQMWDEGLIYRGERLVNFCTFHGTGFADVEVVYKDVPGHLWFIKYPLTDGSGELTIATTRPETMLGDTAVAVHPDDKRYKQFIGKTVRLPLTKREIPVIADAFVDPAFGTGAVKITPAHDPNDYEAAQRHDLPMITVIDHEGKITHDMPPAYRGHDVDTARQLVVDDLDSEGVLSKTEDYQHSVGHCYKCGTIIQPLLKEQWFVDMKPLAKKAVEALRADKITFYPDTKKNQLIEYLKGLRDWNISRQIAWGIPIPAFQNLDNAEDWIFDDRVTENTIEINGKTYRRDPDVFDTWFSSSSWPYATLGYPDSPDYKTFYPNSLMETGGEILYPWVSRMIMMGLYVTDSIPFKEVYIHGYVLAENGSKMSKSVGNVISPIEVIDKYGSDALRLGLMAGRVPGVNRGYDPRRVVEARNFCNKLWNVARFVEDKIGDDYKRKGSPKPNTSADDWMLSKLQQAVEQVSTMLETYRFAEASELIYHLLWDEFADWYIEASKANLNKSVLAYSLETILKLTHPFAPFVTEAIWQTLKWPSLSGRQDGQGGDSLLITTTWPKPIKANAKNAEVFEDLKALISEIRFISSGAKAHKPRLYHSGDKFVAEHAELIKSLSGVSAIAEVRDGNGLHLTQTTHDCWLDLDRGTIERFVKQLQDTLDNTQKSIANLEARLKNKAYMDKAPKELVEQTKQQLSDTQTLLAKQQAEYNRFKR